MALAGSECQRNDTLKLATLTLDIWQIVTLQSEWLTIHPDLRFVGTGGTGGPVKFFLTV